VVDWRASSAKRKSGKPVVSTTQNLARGRVFLKEEKGNCSFRRTRPVSKPTVSKETVVGSYPWEKGKEELRAKLTTLEVLKGFCIDK
jgi:hypothetical protein